MMPSFVVAVISNSLGQVSFLTIIEKWWQTKGSDYQANDLRNRMNEFTIRSNVVARKGNKLTRKQVEIEGNDNSSYVMSDEEANGFSYGGVDYTIVSDI